MIFLRWAWRLRERGHSVFVVSDRFSGDPSELAGLDCFDVRELGVLSGVRGLRRLGFGAAIRSLARAHAVDVVHGHYLLPYGFWAALARVQPLVISPWGTDILVDGQRPGRDRFRARTALMAADAVVVNSKASASAVASLGVSPRRVEEIVWYADLARFGPEHRDAGLRVRLGWPEEALIVLSLRNFRPDTNIDLVVRSFRRVIDREPRARLLLAAKGGPLQREIERLIDLLGLRPYVAVCSAAEVELPALVASADVLVAMTRSDSTPSSLLEAMASGLPAVCADAPSIDEWLAPGEGGEIVPQRDVAALEQALLRVLHDPDLRSRYGDRNRREVAARVPVEGPGPALERLYRRLLAEPLPPLPSRAELVLRRLQESPLGRVRTR